MCKRFLLMFQEKLYNEHKTYNLCRQCKIKLLSKSLQLLVLAKVWTKIRREEIPVHSRQVGVDCEVILLAGGD